MMLGKRKRERTGYRKVIRVKEVPVYACKSVGKELLMVSNENISSWAMKRKTGDDDLYRGVRRQKEKTTRNVGGEQES